MYQLRSMFKPAYEGDPVVPPVVVDPPIKTFTQADVDALMEGKLDQDKVNAIVEERLKRDRETRDKEAQTKNEELAAQLESLSKKAGTSEEAKSALEQQIKSLRSESVTKEQDLGRQLADSQKQHADDVKGITADRDDWQSRFSTTMIENAILTAANEQGALPQASTQLLAILRSGMDARIIPDKDSEGKDLGTYTPVVTFQDVDAESGKPVEIEAMPIGAAVKRMKEMPDRHGNLFVDTNAGGLGKDTDAGAGANSGVDGKPFEKMDPAEYIAARRAGKVPHAAKP